MGALCNIFGNHIINRSLFVTYSFIWSLAMCLLSTGIFKDDIHKNNTHTHIHTKDNLKKIILCAVLTISRQELHQLSSAPESCRRWMLWIMHLQEQIPHWMPVDTPAHLSSQYCCHLMHIPFILQPVTFFLPSIKKQTTVNAVLVIRL
jgi:hypothetical protein